MEQKDTTKDALSEDGESEKPKPSSTNNGQPGLETKTLVWRITTRKLDAVKPEWIYAQVSVTSEFVYRIQFEGEAMDGGFALDDVTHYDGACPSKLLDDICKKTKNNLFFPLTKKINKARPIEAAVAAPVEAAETELRE
ncbi:hypothetical protein BLA29_011822 [Euroglyphus maynei]|uniref:MAM domain-containing protein n=1 Tax=Euroglyphus maynei TaxID=6958 RepID=A0A1Y3B3M2_EURMA|nr:hypothetical protein BLA29_011822 [Euroglyphus maynei]